MSILWEKSETWRWLVRKTRDSKPFFFAFATICGVVPGVVGYFVMQATNSRSEQLEAQLRKNARPESLMMGRVNRERLAEYLGELQRRKIQTIGTLRLLEEKLWFGNHMREFNLFQDKKVWKKLRKSKEILNNKL